MYFCLAFFSSNYFIFPYQPLKHSEVVYFLYCQQRWCSHHVWLGTLKISHYLDKKKSIQYNQLSFISIMAVLNSTFSFSPVDDATCKRVLLFTLVTFKFIEFFLSLLINWSMRCSWSTYHRPEKSTCILYQLIKSTLFSS